MMKYENIPYRNWRKGDQLVETTVSKRVMKRVGEAMKAGKAIQMDHQIINAKPKMNKPYDTITVVIS
jgi:hypothetical protein